MMNFGSVFLGFRMLFRSHASRKTTRHLVGAIIGIGLSLVPLITVLEVSGGMIEGITRRFIEIGSYHMQIRNYSPYNKDEADHVLSLVAAHEEVKRCFPVIFGEGLVYSPGAKTGVSVRSLPPDYYSSDEDLQTFLSIDSGEFRLDDQSDALLSKEVAGLLDVEIGDRVRLLTARTMPGRAPILRPTMFTVRGIFSTGYYELDSLSMYIPLVAGEVLFNEAGSRILGVKVADPYGNIESVAKELQSALPNGWFISTWYRLERSMLESFQSTRNILIFIMVLIVIVAAMNISSSMIMLVMEKEPEIAMMKSMGVRPSSIRRAFLYTGLFIGLTSVATGITFGLLVAVNINELIRGLEFFINWITGPFTNSVQLFDRSYYLEQIPIRINLIDVCGTAMGTLLLSAAAAYFPARRAGSVKPVEILRKH